MVKYLTHLVSFFFALVAAAANKFLVNKSIPANANCNVRSSAATSGADIMFNRAANEDSGF